MLRRASTTRPLVRAVVIALVFGSAPASAQVVRQLTDAATGQTSLGALDDAGNKVFAFSSNDPIGSNPDRTPQIFAWDAETGDAEQLSFFEYGVLAYDIGPAVSDDGQKLLFVAAGDLVGSNADGSTELFVMDADGSGLTQLTNTPSPIDGTIGFYDLAGNGARAVFSSDADYLGGNPNRSYQLYTVNSDNSGLTQLTHGATDIYWPSISDDGQRVTFSDALQIWAVNADGTDLRPLTSFPAGFTEYARIAGNGSTIAFQTTSWELPRNPNLGGCIGGQRIGIVNWDGSGLIEVAAPCVGAALAGDAQLPDITDDAQLVFYTAGSYEWGGPWEVYRVNRDGTGTTALTDADPPPGPQSTCFWSRAAGGGNRVGFVCEGAEPYGGPNPDHGRELYAMSGSGTGHRQLSDGVFGDSEQPDITADGGWIVFASDIDPVGDAPAIGREIYRIVPDGSSIERLTDFADRTPANPSIADDGVTVVFEADEIWKLQAGGGPPLQLTPGTGRTPEISGDGSVVVLVSREDFTGGNPGLDDAVYAVLPDGSGLELLALGSSPRIDDAGQWIVYKGAAEDQQGEVFRIRADGTQPQQLSSGFGSDPDISADGTLVVYSSEADPLGNNPDGNSEIFVWEEATGTTRQLTVTASGYNGVPSLSRDGAWVYFASTTPFFEDDAGAADLYRIASAGGSVERVGALPCWLLAPLATDDDGGLTAFAGGNCTASNPGSGAEVFVVDRLAPARVFVSPGSDPTVVSWDAESGPRRYDVIRGDVADLSSDSGSVSLGAVLCIENDSDDLDTSGFEDNTLPIPGQVFFYLYRGSAGINAGAGSYGQGSGNQERLPASGGCAD